MSDQEENNNEESGLLTKRDFMVACQALAETHNRYLEAFKTEEALNEYSREEMEHAIRNTHMTFMKFQAILAATVPTEEPNLDVDPEGETQSVEAE